MKRVLVCSVAALAILCAGSITLAKNATGQKKATTADKPTADMKKALTPAEKAKKTHETEMATWKEVLKVAQDEKATKTIAAIEKVIKAKDEAFKKELALLEKPATTSETKTSDVNKPAAKKN
jgi:hypothetical protein